MEIYSEASELFLRRMRIMAREILANEVGLPVTRSRFEFKRKLYPLHIVIFEDQKKLGDYDSSQWRIGLSKRLMREAKDAVIRDVLRHEIAHLMTHLEFGDQVQAHGSEFKSVCTRFGWSHEISSAALELANANESYEGDASGEKLLARLKKLMALSESSNPHEAELATTKANELLIRHNLDRLDLNQADEVYVIPVLLSPRSNTKMHAIYEILKTFYVAPVFTKRQGQVALDVVGDRTAVKFAEYVAGFLSHELDRLWEVAKKENQLKGMRAKNSFFAGLARGYVSKIKEAQKSFDQAALIKVDHQSQLMLKRVYGRLSSTSSQSRVDSSAHNHGTKAGRNLTIRPGVERSSRHGGYLTYDS